LAKLNISVVINSQCGKKCCRVTMQDKMADMIEVDEQVS